MGTNGEYGHGTGVETPELIIPESHVLTTRLRRPGLGIRLNVVLFLTTVFTTLFAGTLLVEMDSAADPNALLRTLVSHPYLIYRGWPFSLALLSILLAHELGHYLMSRRHKVDASLPYFIPAPTLIGTFGAVIKIRSNVPDKRALLDIGAAGPIAGFIVSIPAVVIGLKLSTPIPVEHAGEGLFGTSIILELLASAIIPSVPEGYAINLHPILFAGWIGMLVTMMNLLPIGMMDGGHIAYALFGRRHHAISRAVVVLLLTMGLLSWSGWAVWGMLNLMFGLRHPPPVFPEVSLDRKRKLVGALCGILFLLTFVPVPYSMG
ncbi:MAG: site-2 protease family protein [Candidatus Abyssubacteria bacterium]